MERADIAIIGTGPAGLSAAVTAKIRGKKILLIGREEFSKKIKSAKKIENYLGLPGIEGEKLKDAFAKHLESMDIEITSDIINTVYSFGEYFVIQGQKSMYEADTVILAAGMSVVKPFEGEEKNLGNGVSYCATCDAFMYRDRDVVVIAHSKEDEEEAAFLAEGSREVVYIPMYKHDNISLGSNVKVIENAKIKRLERKEDKMAVYLEDKTISTDGVFVLREMIALNSLVPGLKITDNYVECNKKMETNIDGLFVCGDITGAPFQYIKAAGEGNVAALSAVSYLAKLKKGKKE